MFFDWHCDEFEGQVQAMPCRVTSHRVASICHRFYTTIINPKDISVHHIPGSIARVSHFGLSIERLIPKKPDVLGELRNPARGFPHVTVEVLLRRAALRVPCISPP